MSRASDGARQELEQLVPTYEVLSKVHLIQSLVSRILVEMVFGTYYVGLSAEQAQQLRNTEAMLLSLGKHSMAMPAVKKYAVSAHSLGANSYAAGSQEAVNQWRASTLSVIRRESQHKCQAETDAVMEAVVERVNRLLTSVSDAHPTHARDQGLRAQISNAVDLARLLAVQKAVFSINMPEVVSHQQTWFDPAIMEDIGGEDEEALQQREIMCVTFPGIIKRGDESGSHMQYQNVIAKARVFCSPE